MYARRLAIESSMGSLKEAAMSASSCSRCFASVTSCKYMSPQTFSDSTVNASASSLFKRLSFAFNLRSECLSSTVRHDSEINAFVFSEIDLAEFVMDFFVSNKVASFSPSWCSFKVCEGGGGTLRYPPASWWPIQPMSSDLGKSREI